MNFQDYRNLMITAAKELIIPYINDPSKRSFITASTGNEWCVYRGKGGRMCAFARACTPAERKNLVEKEVASKQKNLQALLKKKYKPLHNHKRYWDEVQSVHDGGESSCQMKGKLIRLVNDIESGDFDLCWENN